MRKMCECSKDLSPCSNKSHRSACFAGHSVSLAYSSLDLMKATITHWLSVRSRDIEAQGESCLGPSLCL
jgi:hypothetical protein